MKGSTIFSKLCASIELTLKNVRHLESGVFYHKQISPCDANFVISLVMDKTAVFDPIQSELPLGLLFDDELSTCFYIILISFVI